MTSTTPFDYTSCSERNRPYQTEIIEVAGGVRFVTLAMTKAEVENSRRLLYIHVNRESRKYYIGQTTMRASVRFNLGHGYRLQRALAAAIKYYGWQAFDTYVLSFADDDASLLLLEIQAIKDAGGHRSHNNYNMSPGGDFVADNGKAVICVHMPTMEETEYESATACGLALEVHKDGVSAVARGDKGGRRQRRRENIGDYYFYFKGEIPNYPNIWGKGARSKRFAESMGRPIIAINLDDRRDRRRFSSSTEAARELGLHLSCVLEVVSGKMLSAGGWYFHPEGQSSEVPMLYGTGAARAKRDVTVYAVNLKSGEKTKHRNATVAGAAFGISPTGVSQVICGECKSQRGYWFTHDANAEPPATFGKASVRFCKEQPVVAVQLETGEKIAFASAKAASERLGIARSSISRILNPGDPKRAAMGYTFEKIDNTKLEEFQAT